MINKSYNIGNIYFKSKKECYLYTKNIIKKLGCCIIDKDHHYFDFFNNLLKNHTDYDKKVGCGIDHFEIGKNPINNNFFEMRIKHLDKNKIAFSWVHCCEFKKRSFDWHLSAAMREAIIDVTVKFRHNNKMKCNMCGTSDNDVIYHVDHVIPFINLKNDFLKITKQNLPTSFSTCLKYGICKFSDDDVDFKNEWIEYHNANCVLQILCRPCNNYKGKHIVHIVVEN